MSENLLVSLHSEHDIYSYEWSRVNASDRGKQHKDELPYGKHPGAWKVLETLTLHFERELFVISAFEKSVCVIDGAFRISFLLFVFFTNRLLNGMKTTCSRVTIINTKP